MKVSEMPSAIDTVFRELRLERVPVTTQACVTREVLADAMIRGDEGAVMEHITRQLIFHLDAYLLALGSEERVVPAFQVAYPATWWEAVKERWLPAWLARRFPVRYKVEARPEERFKVFAKVCPHLRMPRPAKDLCIAWLADDGPQADPRAELEQGVVLMDGLYQKLRFHPGSPEAADELRFIEEAIRAWLKRNRR